MIQPKFEIGSSVLFKGRLYRVQGISTRDTCSFLAVLKKAGKTKVSCGNDCKGCMDALEKFTNSELLFSYTLFPLNSKALQRQDSLSGVSSTDINPMPKISPARKKYI